MVQYTGATPSAVPSGPSAATRMRARQAGLIINVVSIAGRRGFQLAGVPYTAAKFAQGAIGMFANFEAHADGAELLGIGDGFVEIQNAKELGGIAIGCATDEEHRSGRIEDWKRTRLINAGADVIIPDYRNWPTLVTRLFP